MQTALLKEYVSKAKDLELSCYEQKLLCDNLEQKLSHINYQRKNKENEKKEFKKFSWINYIASAIWWGISVLPPLIGISMLVGVALYIIALICGIMHFSIPFIDRIYIFLKTYPVIGMFKLIFNCIIIGAGGGFLLLFLCGIISGSKKNVKKENQKIEENNTNVQKELIAYESKSQIISNNLACARRSYQTTLKTKEDFYSLNIIYPKYRSLIPISSFCDYLQSGVCETLEGHEGCYNKFDLEVRLDTIISRIDDVIDNLDQIKFNQHTLYEEVVKCNEKLDNLSTGISEMTNNITGSIEEVKAKTVAAINGNDHSNTMLEYYAEETLHNVNNIKWLQQMDYIDRGGHAW